MACLWYNARWADTSAVIIPDSAPYYSQHGAAPPGRNMVLWFSQVEVVHVRPLAARRAHADGL